MPENGFIVTILEQDEISIYTQIGLSSLNHKRDKAMLTFSSSFGGRFLKLSRSRVTVDPGRRISGFLTKPQPPFVLKSARDIHTARSLPCILMAATWSPWLQASIGSAFDELNRSPNGYTLAKFFFENLVHHFHDPQTFHIK